MALPAALGALGLAYASVLWRGAGLLAHLESAELDATARALPFVVPPVAALLGWLVARTLDEDGAPWRPLRVLGWTLGAGAIAGLLAGTLAMIPGLFPAGSASTSGGVQVGLAGAGAVAGAAAALPGFAVVLALLLFARRRPMQLAGLAVGLTLTSLAASAALIVTRPRDVPPELALGKRPPPVPGKARGAGPPDESPEQKQRRQVAGVLDELAEECRKERPAEVERILLEARTFELIDDVFRALVDDGLYDAVEQQLRHLPSESPALAALIEARPGYGADTLNAEALRAIKERGDWKDSPFALIIVPGYTPVKARKPLALDDIDAAVKRLKLAVDDLKHGLAPYLLVSGGSVHPAGTPHNEALSMRDWLIRQGVDADRILVDPFARHSTTNLRNAGRMMRELGMKKALIVTGFESSPFDQAFYFAHPVISSFAARSKRELGYSVGQLDGLDDHHIAFVPSPEVTRINPHDPLDW